MREPNPRRACAVSGLSVVSVCRRMATRRPMSIIIQTVQIYDGLHTKQAIRLRSEDIA